MNLTHGSLFSGIGGIDLGFERAGISTLWQVENDLYATQVLQKRWPVVRKYKDIKTVGAWNLKQVDIISGGFPCQDISTSGAVHGPRRGLEGEKSGLWGEMLRVVRTLQPKVVFIENVRQLLSIQKGQAFQRVLSGLAESGYVCEWDVLPASAFGLPHQRHRICILGYSTSLRWSRNVQYHTVQRKSRSNVWKTCRNLEDISTRPKIPKPLIRGSNDGIPHWMDRLHGLGNAVAPPMAEWVGRNLVQILEHTL